MLTYLLPTTYLLGCLCLALVSFCPRCTLNSWGMNFCRERERERAKHRERERERERTQRHREKTREWDREKNREWNSTERERARGTGTQKRQREKQTEESSSQSRFGYYLARCNCKEVGPFLSLLIHRFLSVSYHSFVILLLLFLSHLEYLSFGLHLCVFVWQLLLVRSFFFTTVTSTIAGQYLEAQE